MSFSDNLKKARKDKGLSQEDLAELLEVSRQAVSKWEMGDGYPEVEKLLLISKRLNISLDTLLDTGVENDENPKNDNTSTELLITSPNENVIIKCIKVVSSQEFKTGKRSPKYALYGANGTSSLFGENSTFLAWYADKESISREISEIQTAMVSGADSYELKYSVKTQKHFCGIRIVH